MSQISPFCTLPRGEKSSNLIRRKTWTNGQRMSIADSADSSYTSGACERQNNAFNENCEPQTGGLSRTYRSEMCLSEMNELCGDSNTMQQRLYYAVDSFDDVKAIRRSSLSSVSPESVDSVPNFYGDNDSAYESSSESLRLAKESAKSGNKYFTLPTKLGRKLKKMNSIENRKSVAVVDEPAASLSASASPVRSSPIGNQTVNGNSTSDDESFHCCCRMGCHSYENNGTHQRNGGKLHCCHQPLETLWEEPTGNGYENQMMTVFENSLSSMSSKLHRLNLVNRQKDVEIHQLRSHLEAITLRSKNASNSWLRGLRTKSRSKSVDGRPPLPPSSQHYAPAAYEAPAAVNYYGYSLASNAYLDSELIYKLQQQLREKDKLLQEIKLESINNGNQVANLKEIISQLKKDITFLVQENQKLSDVLNKRDVDSQKDVILNCEEISGRRVNVYSASKHLGYVSISPKTNWEQFDALIQQIYIQCNNNPNKSADNLIYYEVGYERIRRYLIEAFKSTPELLPFGYLVEENSVFIYN